MRCQVVRGFDMKKLTVLFASLMIAVAVNAASYNWSGANVKLAPGDEASAVTSYTIYLVDASMISSEVLSGQIAAGNYSSLNKSENVVATTNGIMQPNEVSDKYGAYHTVFRWSQTEGLDNIKLNGEYYTIILNGDLGEATHYLITQTQTASSPFLGSTAINFGNQIENNWVPITPAPEPTSGLLILIGAAGLALRRKNSGVYRKIKEDSDKGVSRR